MWFIMLYKVVLTFKTVEETLVYDHSNESDWAVLPYGDVYYTVKVVLLSGKLSFRLTCILCNRRLLVVVPQVL